MAGTIPIPVGYDPARDASVAQVFLQPIAAPSILGLYGFAGATFMVAAHMAHWFGGAHTDLYLAPFAARLGGVAQFAAGMWAFKARDGLATAMHGMWGAFWIAFGLLQYCFLRGLLVEPAPAFASLGYWFIVLAAITWAGAAAATAENKALTAVLVLLAAGSTLAAIGYLLGNGGLTIAAGYFFIASAICAWYTASALLLESTFKRPVLAVGKTAAAKLRAQVNPGIGEPGVVRGQ